MDYYNLTDEQIVFSYKEGDFEALEFLVRKYTPLVYKCKKNKFAMGYNEDDFIQEGYVGIINAVNNYNELKDTSFYTFAMICIENNMNKLIEKSLSKKNQFFNNQTSLDDEVSMEYEVENGNTSFLDPANIVISKITNEDTIKLIEKNLSKNELEVYKLYLEGYEYKEIARKLNKKPKVIDNTLQRIKNKAKNIRNI